MKMTMRLKYMWTTFVDLVCAIGHFLFMVGVPVVATIGFITLMSYIPWWASALISATIVLIIYLWIRADFQYAEDYEVSKMTLHDKYYEITKIWINMTNEGKSCRTVYGLMTALIDEYDTLLEYHKKLYGEDETYNLYCDRVDKFIKCCQENEEAEKKRQEERAAQLKEMCGNGEVVTIEEGILI